MNDRIAAVTPSGGLGPLLRAVRRKIDASQREFAERAGVSRRVIETAEQSKASGLSVAQLAQLLHGVGFRLIAVDDHMRPALESNFEQLRDRGGRCYPAHLDVRVPRRWRDWWGDIPFSTYADPRMAPRQRPKLTFDRERFVRDQARSRREAAARLDLPPTVPPQDGGEKRHPDDGVDGADH